MMAGTGASGLGKLIPPGEQLPSVLQIGHHWSCLARRDVQQNDVDGTLHARAYLDAVSRSDSDSDGIPISGVE